MILNKTVFICILGYSPVLNGLLICTTSQDINRSPLINLLNNYSVQYSSLAGDLAKTPAKTYDAMITLNSRLEEWLGLDLVTKHKAETEYDDSKRNTGEAWTSRPDVYKGDSYDTTLSILNPKDLKTQAGHDSIDKSKDIDKLLNLTFKSEGDSEEDADFVLEYNQKRMYFNETSHKLGDSLKNSFKILDFIETDSVPFSPVFGMNIENNEIRFDDTMSINIKLPIEEIAEILELTEREADSLLPIIPNASKLSMCRSQQIIPKRLRKDKSTSESL